MTKNLTIVRKDHLNLTQPQLAERLGVSKAVVSNWESKPERDPSLGVLERFSALSGFSIEALMGHDGVGLEGDVQASTPADIEEIKKQIIDEIRPTFVALLEGLRDNELLPLDDDLIRSIVARTVEQWESDDPSAYIKNIKAELGMVAQIHKLKTGKQR